MEKGETTPKFVALSTTARSIGEMDNLAMISTAYGASQAAFNYIVRKIHFENPGLIAFPLNYGHVFYIYCSQLISGRLSLRGQMWKQQQESHLI